MQLTHEAFYSLFYSCTCVRQWYSEGLTRKFSEIAGVMFFQATCHFWCQPAVLNHIRQKLIKVEFIKINTSDICYFSATSVLLYMLYYYAVPLLYFLFL